MSEKYITTQIQAYNVTPIRFLFAN
jgi:hypothetical protein